MPAFAWSSRFREGQWRAFRKFMLEERRDVYSRFLVIDAERSRLGNVEILYVVDAEGVPTEKREGIRVDPADSTIGKLVSAYVALGGNPFDISMFLAPDQAVDVDGETVNPMPGGGLAHSQNVRYAYDQAAQDGDANLLKYKSSRMGGRRFTPKESDVVVFVQRGRVWMNQEINYKRTRLEELIIKMVDLREQLDLEVEDMLWATGGQVPMDADFDPERFHNSLTAASIAYFFDSTFRVADLDDPTSVPVDNDAASGDPGSINTSVLAGYDSLLIDDDDEDNTAL